MGLIDAILFAMEKHEGQTRKTGGPYIYHPLRVAQLYDQYIGHDPLCIKICVLHDTIEDTDATYEEIGNLFGQYVADGVRDLTNVYTKEAYPDLNRRERQELEHRRLIDLPNNIIQVKLCDRLDNVRDIDKLDPGFRQIYAMETRHMMEWIGFTNPYLRDEILRCIGD